MPRIRTGAINFFVVLATVKPINSASRENKDVFLESFVRTDLDINKHGGDRSRCEVALSRTRVGIADLRNASNGDNHIIHDPHYLPF